MITPGSVNTLLLASDGAATTPCGGSIPTPSYVIKNSLRFRKGASASLRRTFTATGNRTTWAYSVWAKRGALTVRSMLIYAGGTGSDYDLATIDSTDKIVWGSGANAWPGDPATNALYRDPSAWYNYILIFNSTSATPSERMKIYVNGVKQDITYNRGDVPQNTTSIWNTATGHFIGNDHANNVFDGYMADVRFIDGQALDANAFGEFDLNGVWRPKAYAGTYGTNGFWLKFDDAAQIGKDSSGNNNHWTANNIDVAAPGTQATYDLMKDSPVMFDDGTANPPGNYATLNPISGAPSSTVGTLRDGNLKYDSSRNGAGQETRVATIGGFTSGKYYFETTLINLGGAADPCFGVAYNFNAASDNIDQNGANVFYAKWDASSGNFTAASNGTGTNLNLAGRAAGKVVSVAVDFDANKIWWAVDGVWGNGGVPATGASPHLTLTANQLYSIVIRGSGHVGTSTELAANFGQRPFKYTPPAGFKALCTTNLPMPSITNGKQHFDIALGAGAGILAQAQALTPHDLIWIKDRQNASNYQMIDVVRGGNLAINSNTNAVEGAYSAPTGNSVAWAWKAGGAPVANNDGTIASQVSANKCAGFSIVKYTGRAAAGTVGHGLGVTPAMVMLKATHNTYNFGVWHKSLANIADALFLNGDGAASSTYDIFDPQNNTASVFGVGAEATSNGNGSGYIAYCWAEIPGFSSFGSYVGNGNSDGPFIYTGFKPKWVMYKCFTAGGVDHLWAVHDSSRSTNNPASYELQINTDRSEGNFPIFDLLANGFKVRNAAVGVNRSGGSMLYAAFCEHPFKISLAR